MVHFWTEKIPTAAIISVVLVRYVTLNFFAVRIYGGLIQVLAGNWENLPGLRTFSIHFCDHDRFGFRSWNSSKLPVSSKVYPGLLRERHLWNTKRLGLWAAFYDF